MAAITLDLPEIGSLMTEGDDVAKIKIDSNRQLHVFPVYKRVVVTEIITSKKSWGGYSETLTGKNEYSYIDPFEDPPEQQTPQPHVFEMLIPSIYVLPRGEEMSSEDWYKTVAECSEIYGVNFKVSDKNAMALYESSPAASKVSGGSYCFFRTFYQGREDDRDLVEAIRNVVPENSGGGIAVQIKLSGTSLFKVSEQQDKQTICEYLLARPNYKNNFGSEAETFDVIGMKLYSNDGSSDVKSFKPVPDENVYAENLNINGFSIQYEQKWIDPFEPTHKVYMTREHSSIFSFPAKETVEKYKTISGGLPDGLPIVS